jgi:hypothetical protein
MKNRVLWFLGLDRVFAPSLGRMSDVLLGYRFHVFTPSVCDRDALLSGRQFVERRKDMCSLRPLPSLLPGG